MSASNGRFPSSWREEGSFRTTRATSLGTVLNAETTRAFGSIFASSSAPDEVRATTRAVLSAFIGSEQPTMTLPDKSPACFNTSSIRDQCTASKRACAYSAASPGAPARAFRPASRASPSNLLWLRVAEHHLMPRAREERSKLAAHQPRTQNANSHVILRPTPI